MGDIEGEATLSQTLLAFSDNSKINVVADTTRNERDPDADLVTVWPKVTKVASVLNKQSLVFGYYWNQFDTNTIVVWPKPNTTLIARTIAQNWEQQTNDNQLDSKTEQYLASVAEKIDREGNELKRNQDIVSIFQFSALSAEERELLLPLVRRAQRASATDYDQHWLQDDFWTRANVSNKKGIWTVSASISTNQKDVVRSAAHQLTSGQSRRLRLSYREHALASDAENVQLGRRIEGGVLPSLTKLVSLNVEDRPVSQVLKQLSDESGVPIALDDAALTTVKDKHLTIVVKNVALESLLRDIALLYDLLWKVGDGKVSGTPNENTFQNTLAKVGNLPSLETWNSQRDATQPEWNELLLQEVAIDKARARGGVAFTMLSSELQQAFRAFNENIEAYRILMTQQNALEPLPADIQIRFQLFAMSRRRNKVPLPDQLPTPEELRVPEIRDEYDSTYYETYRPFRVTVSSNDFETSINFPNGIPTPKIDVASPAP